MKKSKLNIYNVAITKTVVTHIKVEAATRLDAYNKIEAYGATEAVSDFPVADEFVSCRIGYIVKISK